MARDRSRMRLAMFAAFAGILVVLSLSTAALAAERRPVLKVPAGFTVEQVAAPPLVGHPMMAGFDERGRLFIAESAGKNLDFKQLQKELPNFVRMLEDTDNDGVFDKSTIFADKMTLPSGALWCDGALYVTAAPSLWKLEDTNNDGVADKRTEIVTGFGSCGNGADLHGPFLGPEGWLYFCDGRNGHDVKLGDGSTWKGKAACVYRCRTDGTGLEVVFGGGMDNPVEVAFTEAGEPLVSCNLVHARPHRVDGILFGLEGSVFPYDNCISEFKQTGPLFEPVGDLGWVAVSGLMRYQSESFGVEYTNNIFTTQFNPHRVQRHIVELDGGGFKFKNEDFLTCTDPDFHPTDVLEDADGSLLVIDTGGWFRIGCPTSQIAKPDILGGIYRIRASGAKKIDDPRGLKMQWNVSASVLTERLKDSRPAVAARAMNALTKMGDHDAIEQLQRSGIGPNSVNAVNTLARINTRESLSAIYLANGSYDVTTAALNHAALARDPQALEVFTSALRSDDDPTTVRISATGLGRLGNKQGVEPLLLSLRRVVAKDRFARHAIILALIRLADRDKTMAALSDRDSDVQSAALIALDQMPSGNLIPDIVIPLLSSEFPIVRETALAISAKHPEWAGELNQPMAKWAASAEKSPEDLRHLHGAAVAFASNDDIQKLIAQLIKEPSTSPAVRLSLLDAIAEASIGKPDLDLVHAVAVAIQSKDDSASRQAIAAARAHDMKGCDQALLDLSGDEKRPMELRIAALATVSRHLPELGAKEFDLLRQGLKPDAAMLMRVDAAGALADSKLSDDQLLILAPSLATSSPIELSQLLTAFERCEKEAVGNALVAAITPRAKSGIVSPEVVRHTLAHFPKPVQDAAVPLLATLDANGQQQKARLTELAPLLTGGDPSKGQSLFFGKAACATCHSAGGKGAQVGPDLSKIAAIRTGADQLESVVFPSASIARGYEPFIAQTTDGKSIAGTLSRESADAIYLRTALGEIRVARSTLKFFRQDRTSIMPQGLDGQLTPTELSDLLAFVQSLK